MRLHVWEEDKLVGWFDGDDGDYGVGTTFTYAADADCPVSLSLPLSGDWDSDAPRRYLNGLLPDSMNSRNHLANLLGCNSDSLFGLLDSLDVVGGLVFSSADQPPLNVAEPPVLMTEVDIESQMQQIWASAGSWWNRSQLGKFSLAGNQGKFTVSIIGNRWWWPNASLPSTHIIKPDGKELDRVSEVEDATLSLARRIGLTVTDTNQIKYGERTGFIIERFDRSIDSAGVVRRLRTEDLGQALSIEATPLNPEAKYDPTIKDVVELLRANNAAERTIYTWFEQLVFNNCVGNWDAHSKNYSLFLKPSGIEVTPLYDSLCMAHWPQFHYGTFAMAPNDVYDPWEVRLQDWRAEAASCRLDPDVVEGIVRRVETELVEFDYTSLPCKEDIAREMRDSVLEYGRDLIPDLGISSSKSARIVVAAKPEQVQSTPPGLNDRADERGAAAEELASKTAKTRSARPTKKIG